MQLIKSGSTEGVWFEFKAEGAPEGEAPARFKIRRIPTPFDREVYTRIYGPRAELRRKNGALITEIDAAKMQQYRQELAVYALVDSERAEVPAEILKGTDLGESAEGVVTLDGKWSSTVRQRVFDELPGLAAWVVEKSNSLTVTAASEEAALGKTS
jgi:hypothetical protein